MKNTRKKKVIFITQALWIGGIETALINLLNHLDYSRYDISCLITENYQDMAMRLTDRCRLLIADRRETFSFSKSYGFRLFYDLIEKPMTDSKLRIQLWKVFQFLLRPLDMRLYGLYLKNCLKEERFDTAVIYSDRVAELAVRSIHANKFLMFYHNADIEKAYHDSYGYSKSDKIIVVSEKQCEKLKAKRPKYASKMMAINNYVDVDTVMEKASMPIEDPVFQTEGLCLVSCGRLADQKGFDMAIKACARLVQNGYPGLHWYVLGVGPEKEKLLKLINNYQLQDHFHLIGSRSNPYPYMKEASLYIQPSRSEGYSLSILEARVLNCPIIATYEAAEEQLTNGVTGTLCDATVSSIYHAILKHLQNPEISERYKTNLSKYSFKKANEEIVHKIESLL